MTVKREEQLPSTGSITSAPIVARTTQDLYDQNPRGVLTADSMFPQCREHFFSFTNLCVYHIY